MLKPEVYALKVFSASYFLTLNSLLTLYLTPYKA